jgi:hypothetical protein
MKQISFINGLLLAEKDGTHLFISMKLTSHTEKEGHYLLITMKDHIFDAQAWFEMNIDVMAQQTPNNMVHIMRDTNQSTVACTNQISTSSCFQTYAASLQSMIPTTISTTITTTITTTTPLPNAWKCHPPAHHLNLTEDTFLPLDSTKKQQTAITVATKNMRTTITTKTPHSSLLTLMKLKKNMMNSGWKCKRKLQTASIKKWLACKRK